LYLVALFKWPIGLPINIPQGYRDRSHPDVNTSLHEYAEHRYIRALVKELQDLPVFTRWDISQKIIEAGSRR
jgi:hypothetical protein